MTIDTRQLHPVFVGEVIGVDLRQPLDPGTFREIEAALDRYAVLVFRNQFLDDDQQIAFSRLFGPLETSIGTIRKDRRHRLRRWIVDEVSAHGAQHDHAEAHGRPDRRWL